MANDFDRRITSLEDRQEVMYRYIDEQRAGMRLVEQTLARVVGIQEAMDARLEAVELQSRQNGEQLGRLEETTKIIVKKLGQMDLRFDGIDKRLDRMEHKIDTLIKPGSNGHS